MGWTNQVVQLLIIQAGGQFTGLFMYSPTVGTGHLIASIAPAAGTDPFGNAYLSGFTSYAPDGSFVHMYEQSSAQIDFQPPNQIGHTYTPGTIDAQSSTGPGLTASLFVGGPTDTSFPGDLAASMSLNNRGSPGGGCQVSLDGDELLADTATIALNGTVNSLGAVEASSVQTDSGTVTSTTYTGARTGTTNVAGVAFTAPASGKVGIWWHAGVSNSSTTAFTLISFEVRQGNAVGSGLVIFAASDNITIQHSGTTAEESKSTWYPLDAGQLNAGGSYNVRLMYRVSGSTGTINRPRVMALPILG